MSRKRLGRVDPDVIEATRASAGQRTRSTAPIAQMAANVGRTIDAEIQRLREENAALGARGAALDAAEAEGRVIRTLDLDQIDLEHIPRDRLGLDKSGEDWAALKASLAARGQQVPIEVVDLGEDATPRYGLITGLRRVSALGALARETGEARFGQVLALVRPEQAVPDKLIAMIEENEIRSNISYYERGRIAMLATIAGVFISTDEAVDTLFAHSDRNRRYKIRCFVTVHAALEGRLNHPDAIGERLGLALAKVLRTKRRAELQAALDAEPPMGLLAEQQFLTDFIAERGAFAPEEVGDATPEWRTAWNGPDGVKVTARTKKNRVVVEIDGLGRTDEDRLESIVGVLAGRLMTDGI